jgi:predicted RNase H-like nuclease (RuvC/YqgF family)
MTLNDVVKENEELKRRCERMTEIIVKLENKTRKLEGLKKENELLKKKVDVLMRALEIVRQSGGKDERPDLDSILDELKSIDKNT